MVCGKIPQCVRQLNEASPDANGFGVEEARGPAALIEDMDWDEDEDGYPLLPPADHDCFKKTKFKRVLLGPLVRKTYGASHRLCDN